MNLLISNGNGVIASGKAVLNVLAGLLLSMAVHSASSSSYAGEELRRIKSLADQEVQGYLAGHGMGLAKAAELNGYPGPKHVLDLAQELALSAEQIQATTKLFEEMQSQASDLGKKIVALEQELDQHFSNQTISEKLLNSLVLEIGRYKASLRETHLRAHLQQIALLTKQQVQRYIQLRGYRVLKAEDHHAKDGASEHSH